MSFVIPGQTVRVAFSTGPTDAPAVDADSTPSAVLRRNGSASGETVTVTDIGAGLYEASFAIPSSGWASGDSLTLVITAVISSETFVEPHPWTATVFDPPPTVEEFEARTLLSASYLTSLGGTAPTGWINAASVADSALDGKGDWSMTDAPTAAEIWGHATRTLTAFAFDVNLNNDQSGVTIGTVNAVPGTVATTANQAAIATHLTDIKGTSFVKDTHSLTDITEDVTGLDGAAMRGTNGAYTGTPGTPLTAAGIRTAIGLAAANLDDQLVGVSNVTDKLNDTLEDNGGTHRFTDDALAEAPTGSGGGGDATATNQTAIIAAINNLNNLNSTAVQAACASAITTYDPPTRTEATADKNEILTRGGNGPWTPGSGGSGSSPTGPHTVVITVTDEDGAPIQNALLGLVEGINSYSFLTDSLGQVSVSLSQATWYVSLFKDGFTPRTAISLAVNGGVTITYEMERTVYAPNADPALVNCEYTVLVDGQLQANESVYLAIHSAPIEGDNSTGIAILDERTLTSNESGIAVVNNLVKGAAYSLRVGSASSKEWVFRVPIDADDSVSRAKINSFVGIS